MSERLTVLARSALAFVLFLFVAATPARADDAAVQTTWRLLDYIAVDYAGAVQDGRIISDLEYAEMREFSATVVRRIGALPAHADRDPMVQDARRLEAAIANRAAPAEVDRAARALGVRLLAAYPVPLAPAGPPDLLRGEALYAQHCASCHGATGAADTDAARALDPPPIAFSDIARARERSLFALYTVISQGLEGTAMASFAQLSTEDRWALAFYSGSFAFPKSAGERGRQLWQGDEALRGRIRDLDALVGMTPAALGRDIGQERADAVTAFLRADPGILMQSQGAGSLTAARDLLQQSLAAYRRGERDHAAELALAAYLDGFEPLEAVLGARDGALVADVERAMGELRAAIGRGAPAEDVAQRVARLEQLFASAEEALAPGAASQISTFLGAFAILMREGLEALLIVIAMIGFLKKAERPALLRPVHAGWISALVAGAATWWAASHLITISGANRELTEGFGSLLAAAILLFVGIWMHGKAQAGAWQHYVREKLDKALERRSGWFLFLLAFIAVYREVFETIIFFAAMGSEGNATALVAGAAVAAVLLAAIAWAMLKLSARLPIGKFFAYSAALIAVLAVVLAGKGVAALQEAGLIGVSPLAGFPRNVMLGVFPTLETVIAQAVMIVLLAVGFILARRKPVETTS